MDKQLLPIGNPDRYHRSCLMEIEELFWCIVFDATLKWRHIFLQEKRLKSKTFGKNPDAVHLLHY